MKGIKKVLPFLITAVLLWLAAHPYACAQLPDIKVSLEAENKKILNILDELSLASGYFFTYDASIIDDNKTASVLAKEDDLGNILDSLLNDPRLKYKLVDRNIVIFKKKEEDTKNKEPSEANVPLTVTGLVKDEKTGKPLEFATVALSGTHLGTITNQTGIFKLHIPSQVNDPILVISMLGYENEHIYIDKEQSEMLEISLQPRFISIQEVIIRYSDPAEIMRHSIKKINDNYLEEHSLMNAYFREYTTKNKKHLTFSEALLEIAKEPYSNTFRSDEVRILRGRKMINVNQEDSVLLKLKSGIHSSLLLDVIKNPLQFISEGFEDYYTFEYSDIIYFKNSLVYVINFRQKDFIKYSLYQGQIYINIEDLAILAIDFELNPRYIRKEASSFFVKKSPDIKLMVPTKAIYHTEYRKTSGKYHLSMVQGEVTFRVRKKRQLIGSNFQVAIEMAVTDVQPGKKIRINRKEQVRPGTILSEEEFLHDPDFWKGFNIIQPEVSLREALNKMGMNWEKIETGAE